MIDLKFHIKKGSKRKTIKAGIPEHWEECTKEQILALVNRLMFSADDEEYRVDLLYAILKPYEKQFLALDAEQVVDLLPFVDWVANTRIDTPYIPFFRHLMTRYYLPTAKLENITCGEWLMADNFYTKFLKSKSDKDLCKLIACLCRPANPHKIERISRDDIRKSLLSKMDVELRAERFRSLDVRYKTYVLAFFSGCKLWVHETYYEYLFPQSDGEGEGIKNPLGWYGLFQQAAESGVFGNLQTILKEVKFKEFCLYLIGKKVEYDNFKKKQSQPSG